jgi:hypothetical protein
MPKPKAKWTTNPKNITAGTDADGTFTASVPLLDSGTLACTLEFTITADRVLTVLCVNEPGAAGLLDYRSWEEQK